MSKVLRQMPAEHEGRAAVARGEAARDAVSDEACGPRQDTKSTGSVKTPEMKNTPTTLKWLVEKRAHMAGELRSAEQVSRCIREDTDELRQEMEMLEQLLAAAATNRAAAGSQATAHNSAKRNRILQLRGGDPSPREASLNRVLLPLVLIAALAVTGCEKTSNPAAADKPAGDGAGATAAQPASEGVQQPVKRGPGNLDLQATSIDVQQDLEGQSVSAVLDALLRLNVTKGKFESDVEYRQRLKELGGTKLFGDVTIDGIVGFRPSDAQFRYDANKREWKYMTVAVYGGLQVSRQSLDINNFAVYKNAFPMKDIEVKQSIYLRSSPFKNVHVIEVKAKVPPSEAAALDGNLSVLFVGKLIPPYVGTNRVLPIKYDEKTVDLQYLLDFDLKGIWLIDTRTGRVLSKTWTLLR